LKTNFNKLNLELNTLENI